MKFSIPRELQSITDLLTLHEIPAKTYEHCFTDAHYNCQPALIAKVEVVTYMHSLCSCSWTQILTCFHVSQHDFETEMYFESAMHRLSRLLSGKHSITETKNTSFKRCCIYYMCFLYFYYDDLTCRELHMFTLSSYNVLLCGEHAHQHS